MAQLSSAQRAEIWAEIMRALSNDRQTVTINKTDLRAAVDAADTWVDNNSAAYNTALPTAARNGLSTSQKARLLMFVIEKRYGAGV